MRISVDPLVEWHGFACIPVPGEKGYSLVISKAGDWTTARIEEPPKRIWIRGIPAYGVLRITPLFRRCVFVATGSGIGPCAPCIFEQRVPIKLLWASPNVRETFGDKLVDEILKASPDALIIGEHRFRVLEPESMLNTLALLTRHQEARQAGHSQAHAPPGPRVRC